MKTQYRFQLAISLLAALAGVGCFFFPVQNAVLFYWIFTGAIVLSALVLLHTAWVRKTLVNCAIAAFFTAFALFLLFSPGTKTVWILLAFAGYMFLMGLFEAIQFLLDLKDHASTTIRDGLGMVLYWALAWMAFAFRDSDLKTILAYFGFYLILQSLQSFFEVYCFLHPASEKLLQWQRWIALPVFFVSFLPGFYLRWMLKHKYKDDPLSWDKTKNDLPVNLRVYIHTGLSGEHLVGHMTFSYQGVMYSYGDYDRPAEKLFHTIGPGILFTVNPEVYVNNCCLYEQDMIFEYGIHLTKEQEALLQQQLDDIKKQLVPWKCRLARLEGGRKNWPKYEEYYADRLWYRTDCQFYSFKDGRWKLYWILDNNCSTFASALLSKIGAHIPEKTGLVSPGEYFEFFETLFEDPQSMVITRSWHDGSLPQTLFDVKQPY